MYFKLDTKPTNKWRKNINKDIIKWLRKTPIKVVDMSHE